MGIQDEVNDKTVSICIRGGRISAQILKGAVLKTLARMEAERKQASQKKAAMKQEKPSAVYRGRQSMEKLKSQNLELSNIEITDGNIKSFEKYARKYEIDYCLKKDRSAEPPRYYVFFKARDVDAMTAAFKEYTGWEMKKGKGRKTSIRKKLSLAKERAAKHREREKTRNKERDTAR